MAYTRTRRGESFNWLNGVLTFDIETTGNEILLTHHMPDFDAPSNYKDPDKIAAAVLEKERKFRDKAALDLDYAVVHSIGLAQGSGPVQTYIVGDVWTPEETTGQEWAPYQGKHVTLTEHEVLSIFWDYAKKAATLAGFNIVGFDLPIIQRRSWALGISPSRPLYNLKPWDKLLLDVMRAFYHNGYGPGPKYRGLKEVCKLWGIPNPLPDLEGSMYSDMDRATQRAYLENDVSMTRELVRRTHGHYWG